MLLDLAPPNLESPAPTEATDVVIAQLLLIVAAPLDIPAITAALEIISTSGVDGFAAAAEAGLKTLVRRVNPIRDPLGDATPSTVVPPSVERLPTVAMDDVVQTLGGAV